MKASASGSRAPRTPRPSAGTATSTISRSSGDDGLRKRYNSDIYWHLHADREHTETMLERVTAVASDISTYDVDPVYRSKVELAQTLLKGTVDAETNEVVDASAALASIYQGYLERVSLGTDPLTRAELALFRAAYRPAQDDYRVKEDPSVLSSLSTLVPRRLEQQQHLMYLTAAESAYIASRMTPTATRHRTERTTPPMSSVATSTAPQPHISSSSRGILDPSRRVPAPPGGGDHKVSFAEPTQRDPNSLKSHTLPPAAERNAAMRLYGHRRSATSATSSRGPVHATSATSRGPVHATSATSSQGQVHTGSAISASQHAVHTGSISAPSASRLAVPTGSISAPASSRGQGHTGSISAPSSSRLPVYNASTASLKVPQRSSHVSSGDRSRSDHSKESSRRPFSITRSKLTTAVQSLSLQGPVQVSSQGPDRGWSIDPEIDPDKYTEADEIYDPITGGGWPLVQRTRTEKHWSEGPPFYAQGTTSVVSNIRDTQEVLESLDRAGRPRVDPAMIQYKSLS